MEEIEIYFRDLTEEKQEEILENSDRDSVKETNWDILPLTIITV